MQQLIAPLSIILFASLLGAREPAWIFNGGSDAGLISLSQGQLQLQAGLTKLDPTGTDLSLSVPMNSDDAFAADARPFFAVRYKYDTSNTLAGLFFTTDTLPVLSDESYCSFPVVGDGEWRDVVVDLRKLNPENWKGTITSFRFDPTNPSDSDSSYQLSRLGFFSSGEAATQFLEAAVDAPDYEEPTHFTTSLSRVLVPGGTLFDGFDQTDFMLQSTKITQPSETTVVRFKPIDRKGGESVVPLCETNRGGFTNFVAKQPGAYRLVNVEVSPNDISSLSTPTQTAIRFVVARGMLSDLTDQKFRPGETLLAPDWNRAIATLKQYDVDLQSADKPATRADAAVTLRAAIQKALGTTVDSPYTSEYFTRDRIRIGAWVNPLAQAIQSDFIETYRAGGFDWIIAHGALAGSERRDMLLRACDKYGIEVILGDGAYTNPTLATAEYFDHPSFAGTYVTDEPGSDQYDSLAKICNTYYDETGGKLPYINLLPMYANAAQLKYGASADAIEYYDADPALFKNYCDAFCEKFDAPYICTDIYPLNWTNGRRTTYSDYCESINVIAASAREHEKDFWCCIQTFAWVPSKRTPTESEFRWQSYCLLSFGCKGLLCWTYDGYHADAPSLTTIEGNRTNAWYDAATVFKEIRSVSDAFVQYKCMGAMTHRCTDETPYLKVSNPVTEFPTIERIECADPLLIGCFEMKDNSGTALTIVNMTELEAVATTQVKMKLVGSRVIAWPRGERTELLPGPDGYYHFTLASGEGIFVEVD